MNLASKTMLTCLLLACAFFNRPATAQDLPASATDITIARLKLLHTALKDYVDAFDKMPDDVTELIDLGYLDSRTNLFDARQPTQLTRPDERPDPNHVSVFRILSQWQDGPIATCDLPRKGEWIVLTGSGEVYTQPVDPAWLGNYQARRPNPAQQEMLLDMKASGLGVYLSSTVMPSGLKGLGVDGVIPGYTRERNQSLGDSDLVPGDLILTVNGFRTETLEAFETHLARTGDLSHGMFNRPVCEVVRRGEIIKLRALDLAEHISPSPTTPRAVRNMAQLFLTDPGPGDLRYNSDYEYQGVGSKVKSIVTDHTRKYLKEGDIILRFNDEQLVGNIEFLAKQLPAGTPVSLTLERDGQQVVVKAELEPIYEGSRDRAVDEIHAGQLDEETIRRTNEEPHHVGMRRWLCVLDARHGPQAVASYLQQRLALALSPDGWRSDAREATELLINQYNRMQRYDEALALIEQTLIREQSQADPDADDIIELERMRYLVWIKQGDLARVVREASKIQIHSDDEQKNAGLAAASDLLINGHVQAGVDVLKTYQQQPGMQDEISGYIKMVHEIFSQ